MRRAHQHMTCPTLSQDRETGEVHLRHHLTETGYYCGRQMVVPKVAVAPNQADEAAETF